MRISPTKLLHGLLYTAPVLLLTLAACGGGGGGGSTPPAPPAGPFTIGGLVSGLTGSGLVLRNNGGDDKTITAGGSYTFTTSVANGGSYNVTVLTQPTSQLCSVTGGSGTASANVTNANVSCVTAYTIGGTIIGAAAGIGPTLQNNGGDNLFIPAITTSPTSFTFSTPVANGELYAVTQLSRSSAPTQNCAASGVSGAGTIAAGNVTSVEITCTATTAVPKFAYVANNTVDTVSAYTIDGTGALIAAAPSPTALTGDGPYSVAVDPSGRFAYVANSNADTVSAYSINTTTGVLTALANIATGDFPISVTIHPSGKFAYTVNQGVGANTISAYSINVTTGALSAMDADGATGTQATIATGTLPYAVVVDPTGQFAYVANDTSNNVSVYTINQTTGALTAGTPVAAGTNPRSIAIAPAGNFAFVANGGSNNVSTYSIGVGGALTPVVGGPFVAGTAPRSVAVDPSGAFVYVANAGSANVSAYTNASGVLSAAGSSPFAARTTPFSVNVDPSGQFVYVANFGSNNVSVYNIGGGGALTPGSPATTATGAGPTSVTTTQ